MNHEGRSATNTMITKKCLVFVCFVHAARPSWLALAFVGTLAGIAPLGATADDDVRVALAAIRARAVAGDVVAQFSLGSMLYYGGEDIAQAIDWFRKAAAQGYAPAEFQMGQLFDFGLGVSQDGEEAFDWYRRAAEHGSPAAQRAVGDDYRRGRGVASDPVEAVRWYRRAADGDDLRAQYQLGQMYFDGTGVTRDYLSAYIWFDIAAGQTPLVDNQKAILELRNIAAARMTPEQVNEAERRAKTWKPVGSGPYSYGSLRLSTHHEGRFATNTEITKNIR